MIIRKIFKFENTHIVRNCSTKKCRSSIHGHSYKVEVLFSSNGFDNAQMIYDFGLMKGDMKDLIEVFDHSITLWKYDDKEYIDAMKKFSDRWVELPVSPTAEQFARVIFIMVDMLLKSTVFVNNEARVELDSIVVHETDSSYAKADRDDAYNPIFGIINPKEIIFSDAICEDFNNANLWQDILSGKKFTNKNIV
ncbi:MAG: 6-carboxytetrahydropterin synthase [Campylobacteraceae bacterium]|nr:6-carboxytetrahydropterin synthase [Campylobacteraceae bacterium]